jgi:hypothetical protein
MLGEGLPFYLIRASGSDLSFILKCGLCGWRIIVIDDDSILRVCEDHLKVCGHSLES